MRRRRRHAALLQDQRATGQRSGADAAGLHRCDRGERLPGATVLMVLTTSSVLTPTATVCRLSLAADQEGVAALPGAAAGRQLHRGGGGSAATHRRHGPQDPALHPPEDLRHLRHGRGLAAAGPHAAPGPVSQTPVMSLPALAPPSAVAFVALTLP